MKSINRRTSRDEVLFAFHEAFECPTVDQIIEWTERHPEFAEDIRAHAAVSWDWAAQEGAPSEEPDESMLANAYSRALSALYEADLQTAETQPLQASNVATIGFYEILEAKGKDFLSLALEIGGTVTIKRSVIADIFNGAVLPPIVPRISERIQQSLSLSAAMFQSALDFAVSHPRIGHANATAMPSVRQRSCEEVIRSSGMTPEQIDYWLGMD